jgi:acetoin utilization deacetylase AcuC-like enzyme
LEAGKLEQHELNTYAITKEAKMNKSENKTITSFHEKFKQYDLGEGHPFRGDRFANAMKLLENQGLLSLLS